MGLSMAEPKKAFFYLFVLVWSGWLFLYLLLFGPRGYISPTLFLFGISLYSTAALISGTQIESTDKIALMSTNTINRLPGLVRGQTEFICIKFRSPQSTPQSDRIPIKTPPLGLSFRFSNNTIRIYNIPSPNSQLNAV